jgi:hypothetical protein
MKGYEPLLTLILILVVVPNMLAAVVNKCKKELPSQIRTTAMHGLYFRIISD